MIRPLAFAVVCVSLALPSALRAADPTTAPSAVYSVTTAPSTQSLTRSPRDIRISLAMAERQLRAAAPNLRDMFDTAKRPAVAAKVIAPMKTLVGYYDEFAAVSPQEKTSIVCRKLSVQAFLSYLGDADTITALQTGAKDTDATIAAGAKGSLLLTRWWSTNTDAAAQTKVIDDVEALAKADPKQEPLAVTCIMMWQYGSAAPANKDRVRTIISTELTGELAGQAVQEMAREDQQAVAQKASLEKLKAMEGKPLLISGPTHDGKQFTSADWKGKVVLVEFWASWYGPCREELPRVAKAYTDFHDKGLEVVGVNSDRSIAELTGFLAQNPTLTWPQLFDADPKRPPGPHALLMQFGITSLPTVFIIDRQGNLRYSDAQENFETLIPALIAEKAN